MVRLRIQPDEGIALEFNAKMPGPSVRVQGVRMDMTEMQARDPEAYAAFWRNPTRNAPAGDSSARDYEGRLKVAKLNIDENQSTPPKYGIRGIPTLMLFKNGAVEATKVGALSKTQLAAFIDSNI